GHRRQPVSHRQHRGRRRRRQDDLRRIGELLPGDPETMNDVVNMPSSGAPRHLLPEGEGLAPSAERMAAGRGRPAAAGEGARAPFEGLAPSGPLPLGEGGPDADPERSEGEAEGPGEGALASNVTRAEIP